MTHVVVFHLHKRMGSVSQLSDIEVPNSHDENDADHENESASASDASKHVRIRVFNTIT